MSLTSLNAISPIDGRYRNKVNELAPYFSEEALIKYRVQVEIEYFIALCEQPLPQLKAFNPNLYEELRAIYRNFTTIDASAIKEIEKTTNHDVKAVEYFIKDKFDALGISEFKEFIHFGLTSQDINNTAIPLSIKEAMNDVYVPEFIILRDKLKELSKDWENIPMLARTRSEEHTSEVQSRPHLVCRLLLEKKKKNKLKVNQIKKKNIGNIKIHIYYKQQIWLSH